MPSLKQRHQGAPMFCARYQFPLVLPSFYAALKTPSHAQTPFESIPPKRHLYPMSRPQMRHVSSITLPQPWYTSLRSPPWVCALFIFHVFFFLSRFCFISRQPWSSSSSSGDAGFRGASPTGRSELTAPGDLDRLPESPVVHGWVVAAVKVDERFAPGWPIPAGAMDTGRYRAERPILLRSDGAIDGA